jgi:hypothetical protein
MKTTRGRLRSYQALLRMAQVRESVAGAELAEAVTEERARRERQQSVQQQRDDVQGAVRQCVAGGAHVDMSRYELLSRLDAALTNHLVEVSGQLADAERETQDKALANWQAKRYRERAGEQWDVARQALHREHQAKGQAEAIELWIDRQEEGA